MEKEVEVLFRALGKEQNASLLALLLTDSEKLMLMRRVHIAKLLIQGMSVEEIKKRLEVGAATVGTVERWLREHFADYRSALAGVYDDVRRDIEERGDVQIHSLGWLRKKYPLHFFLISLMIEDMVGLSRRKKS